MRISFILLALLLFRCGSDDPGFTSAVGDWTYTTPGGEIVVEFSLAGGDTEVLEVKDPKILVLIDGALKEGKAESQMVNVNLPSIESLRVNANDVDLVFPYNVRFENLTVGGDFTKIQVTDASFTYPWGTINILENIEIVRK